MDMNIHPIISIVISCLVSLVAVHWIYFKVLKMAKLKNMVDNPDARKLQKTPVPVMGGLAVYFGVVTGIAAGVVYNSMMHAELFVPQYTIMAMMTTMLYVGMLDDMMGLTPRARFIVEILAVLAIIGATGGCIDSLHGLWGVDSITWWFAVPFTVFACVGIINAINMIDGVNGLSSSLCILCNVVFGVAFAKSGELYHAIINFTMAASLVPFFFHNVFGKSSKMFIGDAGTMVMGILMSFDVMQILRSDTSVGWMEYQDQGLCMVALTVAILAVPVFDTLRVMTMRAVHGKSPFDADKTHLHHKWLEYTHSHFMTMACELMTAVLIIAISYASYLLNFSIDAQFYITIAAAVVLVWGEYVFFSRKKTMHTGLAYRFRKYMASNRIEGEKAWWNKVQRFVDGKEEEGI